MRPQHTSPTALKVLDAVIGYAPASAQEIRAQAGLGINAVRKWIKWLHAEGAITSRLTQGHTVFWEITNHGLELARNRPDPNVAYCSMCGESKPLSEFNRRSKDDDRPQARCKPCLREYQRRWVKDNPGYAAEQTRRSKARYPERTRARVALKNALRSGRLVRPDHCSRCGSGSDIHGHHADYSKPLEVEWLCRACHEAEHHDPVGGSPE